MRGTSSKTQFSRVNVKRARILLGNLKRDMRKKALLATTRWCCLRPRRRRDLGKQSPLTSSRRNSKKKAILPRSGLKRANSQGSKRCTRWILHLRKLSKTTLWFPNRYHRPKSGRGVPKANYRLSGYLMQNERQVRTPSSRAPVRFVPRSYQPDRAWQTSS